MTTLLKNQAIESYLFIKAQTNAIENSKYIESEKAQRDLFFDEKGKPTQDFYEWWISNHAEKFREAWNYSLCKGCSNVVFCKDCLKKSCEKFKAFLGEEIHGFSG
jgi:hypothetical protein